MSTAACDVLGEPSGNGPTDHGPALARPRLVAFDDCAEALTLLRRAAAPHVGATGFYGEGIVPGARPPAVPGEESSSTSDAAPDHSDTTVHEPGVDEPDLVKTDGRRVVTVSAGVLRVFDVATHRLVGRLDLREPNALTLLLHGDTALVEVPAAVPVVDDSRAPVRPERSRLLAVDLRGTPRLVGTVTMDGRLVDARMVGAVARVVVRSTPGLRFTRPTGTDPTAAILANRATVAHAPITDWLPRFEVTAGGRTRAGQVACRDVDHPAVFTGTSMVSVYTVDLTHPTSVPAPVTVVADADTVYATARTLYLASRITTQGWLTPPPTPDIPERRLITTTEIHALAIDGADRPRYQGSAVLDGQLLGQYALSEYGGRLRVAITRATDGTRGGTTTTVSSVEVLAPDRGALRRVGRVDGLGSGETIHGVRFAGPLGYVVTFRQTDPLHVLDLRDPTRPRQAGELKVPGYSAYLQVVDDGRLLGVGQDADPNGTRRGTQVSLFDVADPAKPERLDAYRATGAFSEVETDPHAFLYWPASRIAVVPVLSVPAPRPTPAPMYSAALVLRVTSDSVDEVGRIVQPDGASTRRALVAGGGLWVVTDTGVRVVDVDSLAQRAWLPYA